MEERRGQRICRKLATLDAFPCVRFIRNVCAERLVGAQRVQHPARPPLDSLRNFLRRDSTYPGERDRGCAAVPFPDVPALRTDPPLGDLWDRWSQVLLPLG